MSNKGAVEYYEWVPGDGLSSITASEGLEEEVRAWEAQQSVAAGIGSGGGGGGREMPRRYFRDPLKRSIKGCKSFKEKQNAATHEGVGSDFWNIDDVLYEVYPHLHANMYEQMRIF